MSKQKPKPNRAAEAAKTEQKMAEQTKAEPELKDSDLEKIAGGTGIKKVVRKK